MCKKPNIVVNNSTLKEGFKKKVTNLGHCPNRGEGVRHLEFSVPTSLSVLTPKIELN